jgi:hypothetical protein
MKKNIAILFLMGFLLMPGLTLAQGSDVDPNPSVSDCVALVNNLRYRDRDINKEGEVSTLQDFLQASGYLHNEPTGYFGLLTQKAVKSFQKANDISPTGYVGPITRAMIKSLTCDGIVPVPNGQKFTGYLTRQGPSNTMWGTHILSNDNIAVCVMAPCPSASESYLVKAGNNSVLSDLNRYENSRVVIYGKLEWIKLGGGFFGITATKVMPLFTSASVPVIYGISGPQSLEINQTGTWKIKASDPSGGNLSYSVNWGDEITAMPMMGRLEERELSQSATFSHSYARAGTYTVIFTVTNENGKSTTSSLSVRVREVNY